jgi:hypothetical protein
MKKKNNERKKKSNMKNEANGGHARIATGIALAAGNKHALRIRRARCSGASFISASRDLQHLISYAVAAYGGWRCVETASR